MKFIVLHFISFKVTSTHPMKIDFGGKAAQNMTQLIAMELT
jgi:hypothetical protein